MDELENLQSALQLAFSQLHRVSQPGFSRAEFLSARKLKGGQVKRVTRLHGAKSEIIIPDPTTLIHHQQQNPFSNVRLGHKYDRSSCLVRVAAYGHFATSNPIAVQGAATSDANYSGWFQPQHAGHFFNHRMG